MVADSLAYRVIAIQNSLGGEDSSHIPLFTGSVWYVDAGQADDTGAGTSPETAKKTIGAAISAASAGDAIVVGAGTYTETGLDLDKNYVEMWFEIGAVIDPPSGTALTVSGNYCRVTCREGALRINPATDQTGVLVTGNFCYLAEIRVSCFDTDEATSADIGYDIQGDGADLRQCRCASPDVAAFKIQGDKCKLDECCTGGGTAGAAYSSIGFWITNSCTKARLRECASQGHGTAGFQIDAGCTDAVLYHCSQGGGDGRWVDVEHVGVWSGFEYDDQIFSTTTFAGIPTTYNIFKVTGAVRVGDIYGVVTTAIPNTSSSVHLELYSSGGTVAITDSDGAPDIDQFVEGAVVLRNADATEPLDYGDPNGTPVVIENTGGSFFNPSAKTSIDLVADAGADTYIRLNMTAALASGAIQWHCHWEPLSDDGFLEAA